MGANPYDENAPYAAKPEPPPPTLDERRLSINALMLSAPSANALFEKDPLNSARETITPVSASSPDHAGSPRQKWPVSADGTPMHASPRMHLRRLETIREQQEPPSTPKHKKLRVSALVFVFLIIFLINTLINIDHGVIPAATTRIKEDLNI